MLAAMVNLQPENAVTTGTFARMYNKVSQIGPQPIFQCVHMNFNLPPVIKNLNVKDCSVLGISMVEKQSGGSKETENEEPMGIGYAMPNPLEKFNRRWDDKVQCPKNIKAEDYRQEMSVKEFCDRFNVNWRKGNDDSTCCLHLSERRDRTESMYYPIRMKPHLTERNANPNSPRYWLYCKHLCLWLIPCKTIADLMPQSNLEEAQLEVYWINKYDDILCKDDLALLPKWARVYHNKYHKDKESESDTDEEEDNINLDTEEEPANTEINSDAESNPEDMDADPRAKRAENEFYQNPDD